MVSAGNTPPLTNLHGRTQSESIGRDFQFPARPHGQPQQQLAMSSQAVPTVDRSQPGGSPSKSYAKHQQRTVSPRQSENWSGALSNLNPISRVMSESSIAGTSQTSSDFYSMSNHSDETLTSELPHYSQPNGRSPMLPSLAHSSFQVNHRPQRPAEPETLMMGYAQTVGHFTLDGSLLNIAPFEEVKRRGVQGGGGVVGVERSTKNTSGMFGAFSWGNIGESLGGLLGSDGMSSMAQMKANARSRSIPLLSTPQNLLFVDLRLAPGESKSFRYRFSMPRGLPPSHKGRVIKVEYHLVLGVQRPSGQVMNRAEVPFRVLGSYNASGENLIHNLVMPYVLLHDAATSEAVDPGLADMASAPGGILWSKQTNNTTKSAQQGLEDFLRYSERLLQDLDEAPGSVVASPTLHSPVGSRKHSLADLTPGQIKDVIDLAILRANHSTAPGSQDPADAASSTNRFNIARSGQPVAALTLLRPAYRLGEVVTGAIDFTRPPHASGPVPVSTFSVVIELESAELVDPSLAVRSAASIQRVTRRVHASMRVNTLFARQATFSLPVPASATPTFETTGVSLAWRLRVEFTCARQQSRTAEGETAGEDELLEDVGEDERGRTLLAAERLAGETFEIAVPIRVFGVPCAGDAGQVEMQLEI